MPSISIITACYNHGKYIHEMVDSVLNQTFQDFEIIIVNDGSTDDTKEVLDNIINEKIKVIHSEHKGPSHARNLAISHSKAEIIFNLDADDKIAEDLLEKGFIMFQIHPNAGIVYAETEYFGARSGIMRLGDFSLDSMLRSNQIVSAAFFRKNDWLKCRGYSDELVYGLEDWDMWLSIIEMDREIVKIPETLVQIRTYKKLKESRSGLRKSERLNSMKSVEIVFKRHQSLYARYPEVYNAFRKVIRDREDENQFVRIFRNRIFDLKQKISYLIN